MDKIMAILKQNKTKDNKNFRLIENTYREDNNQFFDIFTHEYAIQVKVLLFWFTIKSYSYTFDIEMNMDKVNKEIDYNKFLAEEYYEFIINN